MECDVTRELLFSGRRRNGVHKTRFAPLFFLGSLGALGLGWLLGGLGWLLVNLLTVQECKRVRWVYIQTFCLCLFIIFYLVRRLIRCRGIRLFNIKKFALFFLYNVGWSLEQKFSKHFIYAMTLMMAGNAS